MDTEQNSKFKQIMMNIAFLIIVLLAINVSVYDSVQKIGWIAGFVGAVTISAIHHYYYPNPSFEANIIRATLALTFGTIVYLVITIFGLKIL